jgi:thioredoxin reductase (NADPH)
VAERAGAGVYYGAVTAEAPAFRGSRVIIVGGGNSAGQGALYLASYAKDLQIVVRGEGLRDTMSQYLIDQIGRTPNIRLRTRTVVERVEGDGRVERVVLASLADGMHEEEAADAVMVFIGTRPRGEWLPSEVLRDAKGFVLTGRDLMAADGYADLEGASRAFAAGDQRAGGVRGGGSSRGSDEPGRVSGGRRIDGGAAHA